MSSKLLIALCLIASTSAFAGNGTELQERQMVVGSDWGSRGDLSYEDCLNRSVRAENHIAQRGCWITGNSGCYVESSKDSAVEILRYTATIYYQCR